jgi:hypothetical protein
MASGLAQGRGVIRLWARRHELTGSRLIGGGQHHAELGAGLALDARERPEHGQLHPEAVARLLELGPRHAEGIEPIGQAHLLDAKPHHAQDQRHEKARAGERHGHRAEAPAIAFSVKRSAC